MPAVDTSVLDRKAIFDDKTFWLTSCCCEGFGLRKMDPLILMDSKQLCMHGVVGTADVNGPDGLCNSIGHCLCFTNHFGFPPTNGSPMCVCCDKRIGEANRKTDKEWRGGLFDFKDVIDNTFWLYYCFCVGVGCNGVCKKGISASSPCAGSEFKQLCCAGQSVFEGKLKNDDGAFCSSMGTCCCFVSEFQLPPAAGINFSLCNAIKKPDPAKVTGSGKAFPLEMAKAPAQVSGMDNSA
jgi:hypothetical protein